MKKILLLLSATLFLNVVAFAQTKESRNVSDFDAVAASGSYTIYLTQGNKQEVVLEGDEDDLERLETVVKGSTLHIRKKGKDSWNWKSGKIKVYITTDELTSVTVSGSGDIITKNKFKVNDIKVAVSGSGEIDMDLDAKDLRIKLSGSGGVELRGRANSNTVSISGSGSLRAEDFEVDDYEISIAGSGKCKIFANKSIDSRISGSGSVYYKGNPSNVNNSASGSGKLRKL